jgi:hypothetical protein
MQHWLSGHVPVAHSPPVGVQLSPGFRLHTPVALQVLVPEHVVPVRSSALATVMLHVPEAPQFWHCGQVDCWQHRPSRQVRPA